MEPFAWNHTTWVEVCLCPLLLPWLLSIVYWLFSPVQLVRPVHHLRFIQSRNHEFPQPRPLKSQISNVKSSVPPSVILPIPPVSGNFSINLPPPVSSASSPSPVRCSRFNLKNAPSRTVSHKFLGKSRGFLPRALKNRSICTR